MNEHDRRDIGSTGRAGDGAAGRAPGKQTWVQRRYGTSGAAASGPCAEVQLKDAPHATGHDDPFGLHLEGEAVQAAAARGVEGSGGALPHGEVIQRSFGRHDVGGIGAHVGGKAAGAAEAIGAEAYATGDRVAFRQGPTLHTAAHEAAHVVQQRAGVSLLGGVGEVGDPYEQHADQVADAVVAGRSAESLLDDAPGGGGGGGIQRQATPPAKPSGDGDKDADADAEDEGEPAEKSEGDKLRESVLASARKRKDEGTEIVSEKRIKELRAEGFTNYTTCIDFAGQTFRDAAVATNGNTKQASKTALLLAKIMTLFNKETAIKQMVKALEKSRDLYIQQPLDKLRAKKAKVDERVTQLEGVAPTGNSQQDQRTAIELKQKQHEQKLYQHHIDLFDAHLAKIGAKIGDQNAKASDLQQQSDAWIRPTLGLEGGRPKPGEYVLFGMPSKGTYGLPQGAFAHIAVLASDITFSDDSDAEPWHTIDGGGTKAKEPTYYVRRSDLMVFMGPPDRPGARPLYCLLGWIDMDKLAADDDEPAPATPPPGPG